MLILYTRSDMAPRRPGFNVDLSMHSPNLTILLCVCFVFSSKNTRFFFFFFIGQVQWLFAQCLSILQVRGAEMAEFDPDADILQMLVYY